MLYITSVLLLLVIIILGIKLYCSAPQMTEVKQLSDEDYDKELRSLARQNRFVSYGKGVSLSRLMPTLYATKKKIDAKNRANKILTESEKWFFENFYNVKRSIENFPHRIFNLLPTAENNVRIINLARFIVANNFGDLSRYKIEKSVDIINSEISLYLQEIKNFKFALIFALVERIHHLSLKIDYSNKMENMARKNIVIDSYLKSDIYNFYLIKNLKFAGKAKDTLSKNGINIDNIELNYTLSVNHTNKLAKYLITSLMNINSTFPTKDYIQMSSLNNFINNHDYENMSFQTKEIFLEGIAVIGERLNLSEMWVAKKVQEFAEVYSIKLFDVIYKYNKQFICFIKFGKAKRPIQNQSNFKFKEIFYIGSIFSLTFASSIGIFLLLKNIFISLVSVVPIFLAIESLINYILSMSVKQRRLPAMNYENVPENAMTMVVVSAFVSGNEQMKKQLEKLKILKSGNNDKNIFITLLVDFKPSDEETDKQDKHLLEMIDEIKNEDNINVFVRKRVKCGAKFSGYERKRGAIMALTRMLMTGNKDEFSYVLNENFRRPTYLVLLDEDSAIMPGTVLSLINHISHPSNLEFDLLAMKAKYNLYSMKSRYSKMFLSESGTESYPNYSSLYYNLFNKDIFCGKGIVRLKSFYKKLENVLPPEKVLSHDIIEGAILNTASAEMTYEDAPSTFISDNTRTKRWQRGDIQLLPFAFKRFKSENGEKYVSEVSPIYKYLIIRNILAVCMPILNFILGILSFVSLKYFFVFLGINATFFAVQILGELRSLHQGKRLYYVGKNIFTISYKYILNLLLLPYFVLKSIGIIVTTSSRMIMKKNLLEWKTFASSQGAESYHNFVKTTAWSMIILPITMITFLISKLSIWGLLGYTFLSYLSYQLCFCLGKDKKGNCLSACDKKYLYSVAEKTYNYFSYMTSKDALIADNLQVKPYKGISKTTSPTNLGYAMLAEVCAEKLSLIDFNTCIKNIEMQLSKITLLKKWKGNLYNWYDVNTLEPVSSFISSVDSGNFLACIITVNEYLNEKKQEKLCDICSKIIEDTNLEALFDKEKDLFFLGYDKTTLSYCGHYDLLASESRLLSLLFVAKTNKISHYYSLSRDYISFKGNTLCSWSGTTFEYLMTDIFISPPQDSLIYKTNNNIIKVMQSYKRNGIFGVSESCYYKLDNNLVYQYYAFGMPKVALNNDDYRHIVSPYSSVMGMIYSPQKCIRNIKNLDSLNMLSEYGFYESIDCVGKERIVYNHMTHHQGMILSTLCNLLCKNGIKDLFAKNSSINGIRLLLAERTSEQRYYSNKDVKKVKINRIKEAYQLTNSQGVNVSTLAIGNGIINTFVMPNGSGFTKFEDCYLNYFLKSDENIFGSYFYVIDNKKLSSPTFYPLCQEDEYQSVISPDSGEFVNQSKGLKMNITLDSKLNVEVRKLSFTNKVSNVKVAYYTPLALNNFSAFSSHPAFDKMFVNCIIDEKSNTIYAIRRSRNQNKDVWYALKVFGLENVKFECNRFNFIGRNRTEQNPIFFESENAKYNSDGDVLEPCFSFIGDLNDDNCECSVIVTYGYSKHEIDAKLLLIPPEYYEFITNSAGLFNTDSTELAQRLAQTLMSKNYSSSKLSVIEERGFADIFRNLACKGSIIGYVSDGTDDYKSLEVFLQALKELKQYDINSVVILSYKNENGKDVEAYYKNMFQQFFINDYIIIEHSIFADIYMSFCLVVVDKSLTTPLVDSNQKISNFFDWSRSLRKQLTITKKEEYYKSGNGYFIDEKSYGLDSSANTQLPYSNVVCGKNGGFVLTNNGGGFEFFHNSRENRTTWFFNDPVSDLPSSLYHIKTKNEMVKLNCGHENDCDTIFGMGYVNFKTYLGLFSSAIYSQYIIDDGRAIVTHIDVDIEKGFDYLQITKYLCLGSDNNSKTLTKSIDEGFIRIKNLLNSQERFFKVVSDSDIRTEFLDNEIGNILSLRVSPENSETKKLSVYFVSSDDKLFLYHLNSDRIEYFKDESLQNFNNQNLMKMSSDDISLDILANSSLMYQVTSSRLMGKTGYYQVGGATGFRDQLQDSFAYLNTKPSIVKDMILYCAERQYKEGDVMHWFHHPYFGLRSKISDDKLFLPLAVALYLEYSEDYTILDEKVAYLNSLPLGIDEHARFENPPLTKEKGTIYEHCIRAIRNSLKFGEHNLLLIGTGDWNDGIDFIGEKGKGESVMLSMFAVMVLDKFACFCNDAVKSELKSIAENLKSKINLHCYEDGQYLRLFGDDGKWYGAERSEVYKLDLTAQAMAVICKVANSERSEKCLKKAFQLVDKDLGIIKLINQPLDKKQYIGYISAYPKGVRENGGQYTHAAVWYIWALLQNGNADEAYELLQMINPIKKCSDESMNNLYKGEPYVLSGDVYSGENGGRMGWSFYTGSAAWCYRLIFEEFFGIKRKGGYLEVNPNLCKKLSNAKVSMKIDECTLNFVFHNAKESKIVTSDVEVIGNKIKISNNTVVNIDVLHTCCQLKT